MSDETPTNRSCPKCGANFLAGRLYWATGKPGDPRDLAGLVCQNWGDETCINPMRHASGGDTWQKRFEFMNTMASELDLPQISSESGT
jgi:hypothetical protein